MRSRGASCQKETYLTSPFKRETGDRGDGPLTCVSVSKAEFEEPIAVICDAGITNVLALRGGPQRGQSQFAVHPGGLTHASDLIALAREVCRASGR